MVIWSGWGILTILIVVLVQGVTGLLTPALDGLGLHRASGLAAVLGLLAAAAINWMVGRRLNSRPGQELVDKATGRTVVLRRTHRLFFIRMEWWSVLLAAIAAVGLCSVLFNPDGAASGIRQDPSDAAPQRSSVPQHTSVLPDRSVATLQREPQPGPVQGGRLPGSTSEGPLGLAADPAHTEIRTAGELGG